MTQQMQHEHKWTVTPYHHWQCDTYGKTFVAFTICPKCEAVYDRKVKVCSICRYEEAVLLSANQPT